MEGNPFSALIENIRCDTGRQIPVTFRFGVVSCAEPLKIEVAGTLQEQDSLLKNNALETFNAGERVLLLPIEDEQRYIIFCKVVSI